MDFYMKVDRRGLKLTATVDAEPPGNTTLSKAEETKVACATWGCRTA